MRGTKRVDSNQLFSVFSVGTTEHLIKLIRCEVKKKK